jgi:hypothetical protein
MSSNNTLDTKINIILSYIYKNNKEQPLNISHLNFQEDKQITFSGSDSLGDFVISGKWEGDFMLLKKEQKGRLNTYFVGRLENDKIYLFFDSVYDNAQKIKRLNNMEFNALIIFNLEDLKKFCEGPAKMIWKSFIEKIDKKTFRSIEQRPSNLLRGKILFFFVSYFILKYVNFLFLFVIFL